MSFEWLADAGSLVGGRLVARADQMLLCEVGDRVYVDGEPHSVVRKVVRVVDYKTVDVSYYRKPSRGFARHIRRKKAVY